MAPRQQIGLRKTHSSVHKRGVERRKKLLKAAYDLLCEQDIEAISFRDIAAKAGVPEGSAYHFYANRYDLFTALANDLSGLFVNAHQKPVPQASRQSWQTLVEYMVDVGAKVYAENPPARQLFIGSKTPHEVKQADRVNDRRVGEVMFEVFSQHFQLPDSPELRQAFTYFIEITDLIFMISVNDHGEITDTMLLEAKKAGTGYLSHYLAATPINTGQVLPKV
jgi:AcrR family transcriptional regulator